MWNEQLLKYGTELIIMRSEFIKELNPLIAEIHAGLSGACEEPVSGDQAEADSDRSPPR